MPIAKTTLIADPTTIGTSPNQVTLGSDKGIRYTGTTTVWRDMIMELFGRRLESTAGKVDYDYDENAIEFQPGGSVTQVNDRVGGNQEINHQFKIGSSITFKPHLHWWQQVTSNAVLPVVFTLRWRLQRNNAAKATTWTTITGNAGAGGDDIFDFTGESDGLYNQLTRFSDITVDCGLSDTFQLQMARTDSQSGNVSATFFDLHGEVDSSGSEGEITKTY